MGIPDWEADHVTLVLEGAAVHQEVQLLLLPSARRSRSTLEPGTLDRTGFNHVCFRVNDLDAMLAHLAEHGITPRNESWTSTTGAWCSSTAPASSSSWPSGPMGEPAGQGRHLA